MDKKVREKFESYPPHIKPKMLALRRMIYEVADKTEGVGELQETLKWGEPAYLTPKTKSGTTIRIDWKPKNTDRIGLYVSCNTTLLKTFRARFGNDLEFEGNRAIIVPAGMDLPTDKLKICIQLALRYHLDKKNSI